MRDGLNHLITLLRRFLYRTRRQVFTDHFSRANDAALSYLNVIVNDGAGPNERPRPYLDSVLTLLPWRCECEPPPIHHALKGQRINDAVFSNPSTCVYHCTMHNHSANSNVCMARAISLRRIITGNLAPTRFARTNTRSRNSAVSFDQWLSLL